MKRISAFGLVVASASIPLAIPRLPAFAQTTQASCPGFTGQSWTRPVPPFDTHTTYSLTVAGQPPPGCATALKFAKIFVGKKLVGTTFMPVAVQGGPPGWTCKAAPSKQGYGYQGTCYGKDPVPSHISPQFTWHGDS